MCDYINDHYDVGELYMEFVKDTCKVKKEQQCASCKNGWLGSMMGRIPRPFPDKEKLRCTSVFESPAISLDGTARLVDDFMRRLANKKSYKELRKAEHSE